MGILQAARDQDAEIWMEWAFYWPGEHPRLCTITEDVTDAKLLSMRSKYAYAGPMTDEAATQAEAIENRIRERRKAIKEAEEEIHTMGLQLARIFENLPQLEG